MKKTFFAMMALAAALFAQTALAETVEISNADEWAEFATRVNNGETALDAKLTADVTLTQDSPRVGTVDRKYSGTFDGAGHTLTINWEFLDATSWNVAPFQYVAGATIHDLHTAGSVKAAEVRATGLIGYVHPGGATIERCRSSVQITSVKTNDNAECSGFIGRTYWQTSTVTIRNCLFDGSLLVGERPGNGGFVAVNYQATSLRIFNSVFAPQSVTAPTGGVNAFVGGYAAKEITNCYQCYVGDAVTAQGTDASSMSAEALVAALGENWMVKNGKAMLKVFGGPMVLADGDIYTVASDESLQGKNGESAIAVADGASAIINIRSGATLTVRGGNASGTTGAAPAIRVPENSTLYIVGDGTLVATGGAAANGGTGGDGSAGEIDIPNVKGRGGAGGAGGVGGGGGAPAIGGIGGAGGAGGAGGDYTAWRPCNDSSYIGNGNGGGKGSNGVNGGSMGKVVILGNLTVQATAGAAATSDGSGGSNGAGAKDSGSGWSNDFTGGGGGGGGGGARGQNAEYGIGGGGAGGAGGGGGGSGATFCNSTLTSYVYAWGVGGTGGYSYCGTAGGSGSSGGDRTAHENGYGTASGGYGGNGGNANTTLGGNGTFQSLNSVAMTVSPAREAAQPAAQSAGDAVAAPVTVTFMSDGASVSTAQATLMFAPPAAPAPAPKAGYAFQGYYTAGGTQIYDGNRNPVYPVWQTVEDTTLQARWVQTYSFTFVSEGGTVGSATYEGNGAAAAAPVAQRTGDYTFLGYFTKDGSQVFDANGALVPGSLSGLSSDTTLYARWAPPEGSVVKLVYRGQLNLLTGEPAVHDTTYTKKMHFRVYDGSEATTPLWQTKPEGVDVTVNADGSFVHAFGDEALASLIATGRVSHVGLALGNTASLATELKPRRELRSVAAVNRALAAEEAALDIRVGNLVTENAVVAADATVSHLEVAGIVTAPGAGKVSVSPLALGAGERTQLLRGKGVKAFSSAKPTVLATSGAVLRGDVLATAPADGIALVSSRATGERALRCPAVVQYCRKGEDVRAPTSDAGGLKVTFFPFVGK